MHSNQSYVSMALVHNDTKEGFCSSILFGNITHHSPPLFAGYFLFNAKVEPQLLKPTKQACSSVCFLSDQSPCKRHNLQKSDWWKGAIKIFDVILLVPNCLFLVFLVYKIGKAQVQLHRINCPIVKTVSFMVFLVCTVGIARCFVSMLLSSIFQQHDKDALPTKILFCIIPKILWLLLDCFQLAVELSVIIFGLWAGNMRDGRKGVRRVLCVTSICAVAYSSAQAILEFVHGPGKNKSYGSGNNLFGHGGPLFWSSTSLFFAMVYFLIMILPFTRLRECCIIPARRSFYVYCGILAVVDLVQGVGGLLLYLKIDGSLCVLEGTMFVYYALFGPLVYWSFLKDFFSSNRSFHELTVGDDYAGYVNSTLPPDDQIHESSDEYTYEYSQK